MKKQLTRLLHAGIVLPGCLLPLVRCVYRGGVFIREFLQAIHALLIVKPVMQAIATGGRRLRIERIPYIRGAGRIELGDDVFISGLIGIGFSKRDTMPVLRIGNRSFVGYDTSFALAARIEIGEDCLIAAGCRIQDNDGHPLDPEARLKHQKVSPEDIKPVRIGNNVWMAARCTVLKGVTIGDNAVVATGAVVTRDVEAGTIVAGIPARGVGGVGGGDVRRDFNH